MGKIDGKRIRMDFPLLRAGKLHYLDSAATSQKPQSVIDAISNYYSKSNANPHRGIYELAGEATEILESARKKAAAFIGASEDEIIFTKNSTEALNLAILGWGCGNLGNGGRACTSVVEHHSVLLPMQELRRQTGAALDIIGLGPDMRLSGWEKMVSKAGFTAITHVSNVLGTASPVAEMAKVAHENGGIILMDGSQSVPHMKIDVKKLGADFYAFTGHKMLGPMGIGVLYARRELQEKMRPLLLGGGIVETATLEGATLLPPPGRFEAGTQDAAAAAGLGAAIDYLNKIGMDNVYAHSRALAKKTHDALSAEDGVTVLGPESTEPRAGIVSFTLKGAHPHDIAEIAWRHKVAVRAGHHCAQPLHARLGAGGSVRASFHIYNDESEIGALMDAVRDARRMFS
jgi:cysteine desulfurase / selenocysteine lyase